MDKVEKQEFYINDYLERLEPKQRILNVHIEGYNISENELVSLLNFLDNKTRSSFVKGPLIKKIRTVIFSNCTIDAKSMMALSRKLGENLTIEHLIFEHTPISGKAIKGLSGALKTNTNLKTLVLYDVGITDRGLSTIADALRENKSLKQIWFNSEGMSDKPMIKLCETSVGFGDIDKEGNLIMSNIKRDIPIATEILKILKSDINLKCLFFEKCVISVKIMGLIKKLLDINESLALMDFFRCKISHASVTKFSEILKVNKTLKSFHLIDVAIDKIGMAEISNGLEVNQGIKDLFLWGCMDVSSLTEVLKKNKTLEALDISNNPIGKVGMRNLFNSIAQNSTLKLVLLKNVGVEEGDRAYTMKKLKGRKTPIKIHW